MYTLYGDMKMTDHYGKNSCGEIVLKETKVNARMSQGKTGIKIKLFLTKEQKEDFLLEKGIVPEGLIRVEVLVS
jgi:hypothetical protein